MDGEVIAPAGCDFAVDADTAGPPGGRNNIRFDRVALHAVECRWLMGLVENSHGQEEQARPGVLVRCQVVLDVGLLDFDFALVVVVGTGDNVLDFDLGEEA